MRFIMSRIRPDYGDTVPGNVCQRKGTAPQAEADHGPYRQ